MKALDFKTETFRIVTVTPSEARSEAGRLLGRRSYRVRLNRLGIERLREIARQNGKLGGRPRKEASDEDK
jgi:hypothetical protein